MGKENAAVLAGLGIMRRETSLLEERIISTHNASALKLNGQTKSPGLAVYIYCSPGRREMVGGDGDADIFLLEARKTPKGTRFRKEFSEGIETFDYAKLDLPEWGTLSEAEVFLDKSLIEGNQVLETRFICGDKSLDYSLQLLKKKYGTLNKAIRFC